MFTLLLRTVCFGFPRPHGVGLARAGLEMVSGMYSNQTSGARTTKRVALHDTCP